MQDKEIILPAIDPLILYGPANQKFKLITKHFPKLKIIARGDIIKVLGSASDIKHFEVKLDTIFWHIDKYNQLTEGNIEKILDSDREDLINKAGDDEVLVFGTGGIQVKPRTANQRAMVSLSHSNDMLFAIGPAGSGKTYTAVALAVRALKEKKVRRIILTRPAVEAGENLGFLPGDLKEKMDPYIQPLYDALMDMIPYEKLADYLDKGIIEIAPLAFMRGRTLDKAFVILDEAQNATVSQIKMFLTRMGKDARFIITGDTSQIDLPRKHQSGLIKAVRLLQDKKGIGTIKLTASDVIRHHLVKTVINAFEADEVEQEQRQAEERKAAKEAALKAQAAGNE